MDPIALKRLLLLVLGLLVVAGASFYFGHRLGTRSAPAPQMEGPITVEQRNAGGTSRAVRLFFANPEADELQEESRTIPRAATIADEARRALGELVKGPANDALIPTIPPGVELRALYIDGSGTAYADFSRELQTKHSGGASGELLTIYSIVDTLTANFDGIRRVQILVEGGEVLTLAGHIDMRHPFTPRYTFERVY